ncbi:unnamed protein product [Victoria cruziana]
MDALVCRELGDPTLPISDSSPLRLSNDHPIPELSSTTSVRVRVRATSLNYANYLQILGSGVRKFKVGDRVCSFAPLGSFAAFIVAEERDLYLVPDGCDLVAAGALTVAFGTSHVALVHRANLTAGQVLLVLGAAGGVGLSAVQIGKVCGATVIAVARGPDKLQFLKTMGADHVIDTNRESIIDSARTFLKGRGLKGVDVLYDPVGGKPLKESLKLLNWGAKVLIIGFASGEVPVFSANIALVKNWTIHGLYWGSYAIHQPGVLRESLQELLSWLAKGIIRVYISHSFRLSEANLAFSAIQERKVIGKVIIEFDDGTFMKSRL